MGGSGWGIERDWILVVSGNEPRGARADGREQRRSSEQGAVVPAVDSLTEPQRDRRARILRVAGSLAAEGGWDAVQMREVAQGADVALGTLYRYFPSKEYLLVSMMIVEVQALAERLVIRPPRGERPVDRVIDVLHRANVALQRRPLATMATIRALVSGNTEIAPAVEETFELMRRIVSSALDPSGSDSDGDDRSVEIELLTDVWLAALVAWISKVADEDSLMPKLESAAHVLFG